MEYQMFKDRAEAGWMLVERLRGTQLDKPLILAIPRGGVEVGAVLARGLGAELDVVLSRKLRAPHQPELALGAVSESGIVYLNHFATAMTDAGDAYVEAERARQMREIARRRDLFRRVRPQAPIRDRTVILTDDGIATGATMIAAARTVRAAAPREIIVAVPVAAPDRLDAIRPLCDRVVELLRDYGVPSTKGEQAAAAAGAAR